MCIKKGCNAHVEMCHCCLKCYCNESCYLCYSAYKIYETGRSSKSAYAVSNADVRKKFVCFPCKRIWKSSISKYIAHKIEDKAEGYEEYVSSLKNVDENKAIKYHGTERPWSSLSCKASDKLVEKFYVVNDSNPYTKYEKKLLKRCLKNDQSSMYFHTKDSKCAKCGNKGIVVGRNFRHCKTEKEWKHIEEKYKDNEIGLYNDFHDYPREGTEESKIKLENKNIHRSKIPLYEC